MFGFDLLGFGNFLGFGNRRKWALDVFDSALTEFEVNPAYVDNGMRFAVYKWALIEEARRASTDPRALDGIMREAAGMISFCVLGPAETEQIWGPRKRAQRQAHFDAALAKADEETFEVNLIKLVLAKGVAAPDIREQASLEAS